MEEINGNFDYKITDHQERFILSQASYVLNSGGVGSGKSYALIFKTLKLLIDYPGIRILITDSNWPSLRDTTYTEFQLVIPEILIKNHNRTTHQFDFINGSTVTFRAFDKPEKLKRYTFGAIGVEELTDIGEDFFKMARTRLRQPGYPGTFYAATNPSTFQNWVYKYFIEKPIPGSEVIYSATHDNVFLDDRYLSDMDSTKDIDEKYHDRMVLGNWGTLEGLCYTLPIEQRKIPERAKPYDLYLCGVDFGFEHPTAIVVVGVYGNEFDILKEVYESYLVSEDIVQIVRDLNDETPLYGVYGDSSRPEILQDIENAGLPARHAQKGEGSVFAGILKIKALIREKRFYVSQNCEFALKEFDSYVWDKPSAARKYEAPKKENDHAMDAIRYPVYTYLREDVGDMSLEHILKLQKML